MLYLNWNTPNKAKPIVSIRKDGWLFTNSSHVSVAFCRRYLKLNTMDFCTDLVENPRVTAAAMVASGQISRNFG